MYAKVDNFTHPGTQVFFTRHAHAEESQEAKRTKETSVSQVGQQQLESDQFIEQVLRANPDIIYSSDFTRALQTAQAAQQVLREHLSKDVEIITTDGLALGATPENIGDTYSQIVTENPGKRILLTSHNKRGRYLWNYLMNLGLDMTTPENTEKYKFQNAQIVELPLHPVSSELDQWIL